MRRLVAFFAAASAVCAAALLCAGCVQGGAVPAAGSGSVTMYGTVDEGVTFRR